MYFNVYFLLDDDLLVICWDICVDILLVFQFD